MLRSLAILPLLIGPGDPLPEKSLAEIRSEFEAALAAMPAISVRYSIVHEPDADKISEKNYAWGPRTFGWAKDGDKVLYEELLGDDGSGRDRPKRTVSFDGKQGFHLTRTKTGNPDLRILTALHESYSMADKPDLLIGLIAPNTKLSLPEVMRLPTASLTGQEKIGNSMCYRVEVRRVEEHARDVPVVVTAWLDPTHDMLPRRISTAYETDHPRLKPRFEKYPQMKELLDGSVFDWRNEEFVRVANPLRPNRKCWFPKRAFSRIKDGWLRVAIEEVAIRELLPVETFRPSLTPGMTVWDLAAGKTSGSIVGGSKALRKQVQEAAEEISDLKAQGPPRVTADAKPTRGFSWPLISFCVSTAFLVTAGVAWWRLRT